ncbi:MAG: hypothetical protein ABSC38_06145 [Verrucomicrobiia bacterium]
MAIPAKIVLLSLLVACLTGCATVQTESSTTDDPLRPRLVNGSYEKILQLAEQCAHKAFPNGNVSSEYNMGVITVSDYSLLTGETVLQIKITGRQNGSVLLEVLARGFGSQEGNFSGAQRRDIETFLRVFDQAYGIEDQQPRPQDR